MSLNYRSNYTLDEMSSNTLTYLYYYSVRGYFVQVQMSLLTFYDFPDEDFCLFVDFPHQQLIVPYLLQFPNLK